MENILIEWNESLGSDMDIYYDVYIYSSKKSPKYKKRMCYVKDKIAVGDFPGDMYQL